VVFQHREESHQCSSVVFQQRKGENEKLLVVVFQQQLNELEEKRLDSIQQTTIIKQQRSQWHDKNIKNKQFQKGNWALLYDSRFKEFQGKLRTRWLGPYEVDKVFPNGTVRLLTINDSRTPLLVNGHRLCLYQ